MSRREYNHTGHDHTIPDDIPFREDLVFYAPMTKQCCCDYVNNVAPETDFIDNNNRGIAEFDDAVGLWRVRTQQNPSSQATFCAALNWYNLQLYSGVGTDNWYDRGMTIFMQIRKIAANENNYLNWASVDNLHISQPHGDNPNTPIDGRVRFTISRARFNSDISTSVLSKTAITMDSVANPGTDACTCKTYKNGTLNKTFTWNAAVAGPTNPDSFAVAQNCRNCYYGEYYVKDVRIYNRILSQSEIQQL